MSVRARITLAGLGLAAPAYLWLVNSPSRSAILLHASLGVMVRRDLHNVECVAVAVALLLALLFRRRTMRLPKLAGWRGVLLIGALALASRAVLLAVVPVPAPLMHDEFSFLLQADTFAHGRLTNPAHPMWVHFESMHIFHRPTYQSTYFPAQGLMLALGQILGHPWIGQWLSGGLMCAALCWMLQGWLPPGWAFLGSLLALMRLSLFSYWINGYWGGMHPAIGGALALGALPRVLRRQRLRHSLLMALGMVVLANSRPYEGVLLCLPIAIRLAFERRWRAILTVGAVLAVAAAPMGYFNWRVSGSPFHTPYHVLRAHYGWPDTMAWSPPPPEVPPTAHRHRQMSDYYLWESQLRAQYFAPDQMPLTLALKAITIWSFFLGPVMSVPLVMLPWVLRDRRIHLLLAPAVFVLAGYAMAFLNGPHYISAMTGIFYVVEAQALRHLRVRFRVRGSRGGAPLIVWAIPLALFATVAARVLPLSLPMTRNADSWCCLTRDGYPRAAIQKRLEQTEGQHLAIVRYGEGHSFHEEWVYNRADIDASKVVWARDMGPAENETLISYFSGRRVWLVEPDRHPPRLTPYRR